MSTEFEKDISDLSPDCTNNKTRIDFYFRLVKWPKISHQQVPMFLEILEEKKPSRMK